MYPEMNPNWKMFIWAFKIVKKCFLDICQVLYSEYQPVKMDIFDICHWKTRSYDLGKGQKRVIYFIVSFGIYNLLKSGLNRIKVGCVLTMVPSGFWTK